MRQKQERRREKLVFVLFIVLSLVFHAVLLLFIASGSSLPAKKAHHKDMTAIKVAPVNLPPSKPPSEEPPPESQTPPSTPPSSQAWTPPPTPKPKDKPKDKPITRPNSSPKPQITPIPTPTPSILATPRVPTQEEIAKKKEELAKKVLTDYLKKEKLEEFFDLKDKNLLAQKGYKSYEDWVKDLSPEYQAQLKKESEAYWASRFGANRDTGFAENTSSSSSASPSPNTSEDPASPGPEVSGDPNGDPNGTGKGGGFNLPGLNFNLNINNKFDEFDPLTNPNLKNLTDKDIETDPLKNAENGLNDKQLNDKDFKLKIQPPTASANPLKIDYKENTFGLLFFHDGYDFRANYPTEMSPKLTVSYYPHGSRPQETSQGFELDWVVEWATNKNSLVAAVVAQYEALKKEQQNP